VLPGVNYGEAIIEAINSSRLLVIVLSSASNGSPQVLREVERAVSKGIPVIPFRIEQVVPTKSMEYFLSAPHWLDALTQPLEAHIERLSSVVRAVLVPERERPQGRQPASAAAVGSTPSSPGHGRKQLSWRWVMAAVGAAVVLAAVLLVVMMKHGTTEIKPVLPMEPAAAAPPTPSEDSFVPLFNGKDLKGWLVESGDHNQWRVVDGTILASGHGLKSLNHLLSERDYTDFVLRFDYRPIKAPWSSCAAFRAAVGETVRGKDGVIPWHPYLGLGLSGPQRSLPPGNILWNQGKLLPATRAVVMKGLNEWNEVEMEIRNHQLYMAVNGEEVRRTNLEEIAQLPGALPGFQRASDRIGFAAFDGDVQYRNIRIKDLPPGKPASAEPLSNVGN
jgi:hypothetical protein